jgi:glucoamylase
MAGMALGQGAPVNQGGVESRWTFAAKTGVGTSYEAYDQGQFSATAPTGPVSKVWFSIAEGIVTETAWGLIHEAQIRDLQFLVAGQGFCDEEKRDTQSTIDYLHKDAQGRPLSLAYRVVNNDKEGRYKIEKHVFTHPDRQVLFIRVIFTAQQDNITPFLLVNPHLANTGNDDVAYVSQEYLNARSRDHARYLCVKSTAPFVKTSAGFVGESDGWTDLKKNGDGQMDWGYLWADGGRGNVAMTAQLETLAAGQVKTFDVVVGFGNSHEAAIAEADAALADGYQQVVGHYNGLGPAIGWEDYVQGLPQLPGMIACTGDNGKQLYASALVLKALEDKTHAGALIASLSIPWGDVTSADPWVSGYRAVWVRDLYQVASAFLAMGDPDTARAAFQYMKRLQVNAYTPGNESPTGVGWFLQKTHVDGTPEWFRVQMDQTAMPIMLGWKLWKAGVLTHQDIQNSYPTMLKPAAEFLANGGHVRFRKSAHEMNERQIDPPYSQQERWEEQDGYSPSTVAAIVTGLITAADIARSLGDPGAANHYETKADQFAGNMEQFMFTTKGDCGDGKYFLRVTKDTNPNNQGSIDGSNGQPALQEQKVLDAGFLELVRYGVRSPTAPAILDSLPEIDDMTRGDSWQLKYEFNVAGNLYPGWRRYAQGDGYGERTTDGAKRNGDSQNRGRVWPIFTGERGHYELAKLKAAGAAIGAADIAALRDNYVKAMEHFANEGLMIPEQVWDGVGNNSTYGFTTGEGTNGATPLAWSHAEYVKLVRSLKDKSVWDSYPVVQARYQGDD